MGCQQHFYNWPCIVNSHWPYWSGSVIFNYANNYYLLVDVCISLWLSPSQLPRQTLMMTVEAWQALLLALEREILANLSVIVPVLPVMCMTDCNDLVKTEGVMREANLGVLWLACDVSEASMPCEVALTVVVPAGGWYVDIRMENHVMTLTQCHPQAVPFGVCGGLYLTLLTLMTTYSWKSEHLGSPSEHYSNQTEWEAVWREAGATLDPKTFLFMPDDGSIIFNYVFLPSVCVANPSSRKYPILLWGVWWLFKQKNTYKPTPTFNPIDDMTQFMCLYVYVCVICTCQNTSWRVGMTLLLIGVLMETVPIVVVWWQWVGILEKGADLPIVIDPL